MIEGLMAFTAFLALAFMRLPMWLAMLVVGFSGFAWKTHIGAALSMVASVAFESGMAYTMTVIPLFVLMGNLVMQARLSEELYAAANAFFGHRRGGLAMSTIAACAGFGAICGSSLATAATMGKVAYPAMQKLGYSDTLSAGSVAAGGTLGILIPPSVIMILYALMTEQSVSALFIAAIVPAVIAVALYFAAVMWVVARDPKAGPPAKALPWQQRWQALARIWRVLVLFTVVIGGMYTGVFTSTEAAGVGAGGALVFALVRNGFQLALLRRALVESARTTAMMFAVLIGAFVFANFINMTGMPTTLRDTVAGLAVPPLVVMMAIVLIYVLLGMVLESLSMILLTVPLFFPLVTHLGYDPIWFGIIVVCVTEISLITPPVGMNVFVLRGVLPNVPSSVVFRGVMPFFAADMIRVVLLVAIPSLTLWLPSHLKG